MNNWILLTILYAILLALFEFSKKKAVEKSSIYEVLAGFSLIAFIIAFVMNRDAFRIDYNYLWIIFIKSSIIVVAWILSVKALEKMSISIYSLVKNSRIIFSALLSYFILGERLTLMGILGIIVVIIGLILVNKTGKEENKKTTLGIIIIMLIACLLNSISAIIDKKILVHITSTQLQFWFLGFLTIYYWIILLIKRKKINLKVVTKNYWIPLAGIFLVVGDRFLFIATADSNSKVIIMTVLKQVSVIVAIILGKIAYKEKNIIKKLLYACLIILGIIIMLI